MFWKFGFQNASSIDSLLDKDDVALEAILSEDDLLQECKSQNTRLLDYFQRVDVLQRLLAYVSGQIETEERGNFKYPYVATEVLCSEIWSIVETCVNNSEQLLAPFWETVLDIPPEEMKTRMVIASHFSRIIAVFLSKKPAEMLAFIQSQPSVIERILSHIETPSFVDLLLRIIQLDEIPAGAGVLEWLSAEDLMGRLIEMLSPSYPSDVHTVVADIIKNIIAMAAPSPGSGLSEGLQNGPASNRFARELANRNRLVKLAGYMLNDFSTASIWTYQDGSDTDSSFNASEPMTPHTPVLPNAASATSSVAQSIVVVIELIRKNNSDYFEPYLFHNLRNRLMTVQQQFQGSPEDGREAMERVMQEMVGRMRVVHLGSVLEVMCDCLGAFQRYLRDPRSLEGPTPTTVGSMLPLTFERYRICELYAELLHCSNMSLLNRPPEFNHLYDSEGRLRGGLDALDELGRVIAVGSGEGQDRDNMEDGVDEIEPAMELPITSISRDSPSLIDSDEDMSDGDDPGSSDDEPMEEIAMYDDSAPNAAKSPDLPLPDPPIVVPSSPNAASLPSPAEIAAQGAALAQRRNNSLSSNSESSTPGHRSRSSRRNSRKVTLDSQLETLPIGETLKKRFLDANVLTTVLDLFFEFPWNNFLHSVVYDIIHQILNGRVDGGLNRELTIALFRDSRLMHRIVEGQKRNDIESAKPKGVRLGYMGHLTLISEDVIVALQQLPPDLRHIISQLAPQPDWDDYVNGRYNETKKRDTSLLGGGKPVVAPGGNRGAQRWRVDEEDNSASTSALITHPENGNGSTNGMHEPKGVFRKTPSSRPVQNVDFGPAPMEDDEGGGGRLKQFVQYLAQEMQSSDHYGSDASDEDDEDGGWLSQSTFDLSSYPVPSRSRQSDRRPMHSNGFDDAFIPGRSSEAIMSVDPFGSSDDEDAFGPFSDSAAASGSDPFTFTSFSEEIEDTTFDSFGDFGDFQGSTDNDGQLTPTGGSGSWSFASDETGSEDSGSEVASPTVTKDPSAGDPLTSDERKGRDADAQS